ncbi:C6 transcription factor [Metarhizium guizhouense ARSEF 977]|uniref:C6 transcription factor n=1 Tax=Metarhizium guizhouense (strain ARSEF 977) TaxID=1276136 RepID=A0A0B4HW28_METGA|nr:C6 transcription factor [Metarhizium guizhouense ARSEF 977]
MDAPERSVKRRQYRSCDRCRKSRRACDAFARGVDPLRPNSSSHGRLQSCSLCLRGNMHCTFEWLRAIPQDSLPRGIKRKPDTREHAPLKAPSSDAPRVLAPTAQVPFSHATELCHDYQDFESTLAFQGSMPHFPGPAWFEDSQPITSDLARRERQHDFATFRALDPLLSGGQNASLVQQNGCQRLYNGLYDGIEFSNQNEWRTTQHDAPESRLSSSAWPDRLSSVPTQTPSTLTPQSCNPPCGSNINLSSEDMRTPIEAPRTGDMPAEDQRLASINQQESRLAQCTSKSMIISGFKKIYKDSVEHSLECWLTEHNCPYEIRPKTRHGGTLLATDSARTTTSLYQRVRELDSALGSLRNKAWTVAERNSASRALQLSIMAFASQWSRATHNMTMDTEAHTESKVDIMDSDGFEFTLRMSLWNETRQCLERKKQCDSFLTILAEVVFALVQRPASGDSRLDEKGRQGEYLNTALRHLLDWKDWLDSLPVSRGFDTTLLSPKTLCSFKLIFWFGVMCDTTLSVLHKRDFIIPCHKTVMEPNHPRGRVSVHDADVFARDEDPERDEPCDLWGTYLLGVSNHHWKSDNYSGAQMEKILQEAIPTKVLLWRKAGALQSALNRPTPAKRLEKCISLALQVHNHWNATYGEFFDLCMARHKSLGFKIQSWYVILATHWHLACLHIADCIQQADQQFKSESLQRALRQSCCLVLEIQKASACAIASLAQVSCSVCASPGDGGSHSSCTAGCAVLLTEPLTDVLEEALTMACQKLLGWYRCLRQQDAASTLYIWASGTMTMQELAEQCTSCIDALRILGHKSDHCIFSAAALRKELDLASRASEDPGVGWYG